MIESSRTPTAPALGSLSIVHAVRSDGFAGVERYVAGVARELVTRRHRVTVIGADPFAMRDAISNPMVAVLPGATTGRVAQGLARHARNADVVHVHMTAAEAAALVTWPLLRRPTIATRHFASRRGSTLAGRAAAPLIARMLVAEIAISEYVARSIGPGTVTLVNGVPNADAVDAGARVVLVAQRLEPEKRTGDALDAWRHSSLGDQGWELWIAGDGAERGMLESRAASAGRMGVRFLGRRNDVACLRAQAGIFLAPAPAEPFGLSVAEAMASGLPVIAASGGGHLETVGRVAPDCLYPPGDVIRCAQLLRQLACDVERRRRLGAELRSFQRRALNLGVHVDRLVDVYRTHAPHGTRSASAA